MKVLILKSALLAVIGATGIMLAANAAQPDSAATNPSATHAFHKYGHSHRMHDPLLHAVHHLSLTEDQQQRIHALLDAAKQSQTQRVHGAMGTLANPGDPNYPAAVQEAKTNAADRIQRRSDLDSQIYALLTPEQKAKLPEVIAAIESKMQQHHERVNKHNETQPS